MDAWLMWTIAVAVVALPFVLLIAFNRGDTADSRGRRQRTVWRVRRG